MSEDDRQRRVTIMLLANSTETGGAQRPLVELARGLDKERFRVLVATLTNGDAIEGELRDAPEVDLRSLGARGSWDARAVYALISLLRRECVDVLQTTSFSASAFGRVAAALAGTPVRIVMQGGMPASGARGWFAKRIALSATALVTDCEQSARWFVRNGAAAERVNTIYDGQPTEATSTNVTERQWVRSQYGVLDDSWLIGAQAQPGVDDVCFLQAASIVRSEVPGTKFMMVGQGGPQTDLLRRAMILGLNGSVIFAGLQPHTASYVGAMDVAVLPAGAPASFGIQALGLGRPIVAMEAGANSELFPMGEAGLIVPPDNPLILAHAILELMRNPDAVERMRKRGRELFKERFTVQRMISSYEDLYLDLWNQHRAKRIPAGAEQVDSQSS